MSERIVIYTDGSAIGNPGPGGWAAQLKQDRRQWEIKGGTAFTTISEMELTAALEALKNVPAKAEITLYSDSEYLIQGMRFLLHRWQSWGWKNRRGRPLKYRLLWEELMQAAAIRSIQWKWVAGHSGNEQQCHVDRLAFEQAQKHLQTAKRAA
jgi:ribonuclease HI